MKKHLSITIDQETYEVIKQYAKKENRSVSNYLDQFLKTKFKVKEKKDE